MSADATGWVIRHSPFKGVTFTVHLCIGDSANDQYDQEFWMALTNLATKARCSRRSAYGAIQELLDAGCLEELESPLGADRRPTGKPGRYRFLFPDIPVVFENRSRSKRQATLATPLATTADGQATSAGEAGSDCSLSQENTNLNPSASSDPSASADEKPDPTKKIVLTDEQREAGRVRARAAAQRLRGGRAVENLEARVLA